MSPPSSVHLPVELIEEILSISPVKSLLRFKSVSKQWHAIISDPRFSRTHRIRRSKLWENQNTFAVWKRKTPGLCISLMRLEEDGRKVTRVSEFHHQYAGISSSCNGIFLLTDFQGSIMLWNPCIRKSTKIITADTPFSHLHPWKCGLYHDETSDDYKIVVVDYNYKKYTVYSCKNRSWGEMLDFPRDMVRILVLALGPCVTVDGCVYALCFKFMREEIVFFDVRDGKWGKFPQPNYDHFADLKLEFELAEVFGRLCLCVYAPKLRICEIYVMEKNGRSFENIHWRKVISIVKEDWDLQLMCFINEDNVVRGRPRSDFIWIHNSSEKRDQRIEFDYNGVTRFSKYEENLYMPC